jgi:hypothetical protein
VLPPRLYRSMGAGSVIHSSAQHKSTSAMYKHASRGNCSRTKRLGVWSVITPISPGCHREPVKMRTTPRIFVEAEPADLADCRVVHATTGMVTKIRIRAVCGLRDPHVASRNGMIKMLFRCQQSAEKCRRTLQQGSQARVCVLVCEPTASKKAKSRDTLAVFPVEEKCIDTVRGNSVTCVLERTFWKVRLAKSAFDGGTNVSQETRERPQECHAVDSGNTSPPLESLVRPLTC